MLKHVLAQAPVGFGSFMISLNPSQGNSTMATSALPPSEGYRSWNAARKSAKRFACDRCHMQKLKCPRQSASELPCLRCEKFGLASTCVYSPTLRFGRPAETCNRAGSKSSQRPRAASQDVVLGAGAEVLQASPATDRVLPTPSSGDAPSQPNDEIEATYWTWAPTDRPSVIGNDANDVDLFDSLDGSDMQQDDNASASASAPSTESGFHMGLQDPFCNFTLFKPALHNSPASEKSISSAENCLSRLAELHLSLFQSHQALSSHVSSMDGQHNRDRSSPSRSFSFKSPIDLDSIFAAAQQFIDCIKYLIVQSTPQVSSDPLGILPRSAPTPAAYSDHSMSSFASSLADGMLANDVAATQNADSATLFLVLSCYARLIDIFTNVMKYLKTSVEKIDRRHSLDSVQIGSFRVPSASDLQITIMLQVFCHLFQRAHQSIRLFIAGHGKDDDSLLAPGLRLSECTIKEEIKQVKLKLKASTNL